MKTNDGVLRLKDVQVVGKGRDGFYIRRVCSALAESLRTQFKYRFLDDAKLILEEVDGQFGTRGRALQDQTTQNVLVGQVVNLRRIVNPPAATRLPAQLAGCQPAAD